MILSHDDPTVRVMLVGNRVPPNIQKSLDHHGIAWKELTFFKINEFLKSKTDTDFLHLFEDEVNVKQKDKPPRQTQKSIPVITTGSDASLFAPVREMWIEEAFSCKKNVLYFGTGANIAFAKPLNIKKVFFKLKGEKEVSAVADFIDFKEENPREHRLPSSTDTEYKTYYGFKNLKWLDNPIELTDLRYFTTGNYLKTSVPGVTVIIDTKF